MLKRAILYKDELNKKYIEALDIERNKYFYRMYNNFSITVDESDWNALQFVSVDKNNNIIGYIRADIDRCVNYISSLAFINFIGQTNVTFSKDCLKFFDLVFNTYKFNKIDWCVFVGNPAEKVYDKLIDKFGGRVVGTYKDDVYTYDKQLCDRKLYELMREDYLKNRNDNLKKYREKLNYITTVNDLKQIPSVSHDFGDMYILKSSNQYAIWNSLKWDIQNIPPNLNETSF